MNGTAARQAGHIHPEADGPRRRRPQAPHEGGKRENEAIRERLGVAHHRPGMMRTALVIGFIIFVASTVTYL